MYRFSTGCRCTQATFSFPLAKHFTCRVQYLRPGRERNVPFQYRLRARSRQPFRLPLAKHFTQSCSVFEARTESNQRVGLQTEAAIATWPITVAVRHTVALYASLSKQLCYDSATAFLQFGSARVVESVDTRDLKSLAFQMACGFNSRPGHQQQTAGDLPAVCCIDNAPS